MFVLPVAELVGYDSKNLIVVTFVVIKKRVSDLDSSLGHLSVGVEVAATVSHHFNFIAWVPNLFAKHCDLLSELGMF